MKAAAEFPDKYEWDNHQHTFKQHARSAAKEHYQNERQKTKQKLYAADTRCKFDAKNGVKQEKTR